MRRRNNVTYRSLPFPSRSQRRAFSDEYVNIVLSEIGCNIEISSRNPIGDLGCVNVDDLRNTPCILVASKEQRENEESHYHEIYGIDSEFVFAENLEEARLMVVSGRGFLPIEGGSAPVQFAETIARRVGFGKKIILGDKKKENAETIAKIMNDAGFDVIPMEMDLPFTRQGEYPAL